MAMFSSLRGLLDRRNRRGAADAAASVMDSQVLDPASGLSSSTFGGESTLSLPADAGSPTLPPSAAASPAAAPASAVSSAVDTRQRALAVVLVLLVLGTGGWLAHRWNQIASTGERLAALGQALAAAQQLEQGADGALRGAAPGFVALRQGRDALARAMGPLPSGDGGLVARLTEGAQALLAQEAALLAAPVAVADIRQRSNALLEPAEALLSLRLQQAAPLTEVSAATQTVRLLPRLALRAADTLEAGDGTPRAAEALKQDLAVWGEIVTAQLNGSAALRTGAPKDAASRELLARLEAELKPMQASAATLLAQAPAVAAARAGVAPMREAGASLRERLLQRQAEIESAADLGAADLLVPAVGAVLILLSVLALGRLQTQSSRERQLLAEQLGQEAARQEREARRVNDATQAAILRLMNELQGVAEGDLTQQATVTEDITGAIADSINLTVEELRNLVAQVQHTSQQVLQTSGQMENSSIELLAASTEQLREIRETGQAVLEMARRIQEVSVQAQTSAAVSRRSLHAASGGLQAVQDTMGGMNQIRDQIQDTAKRIKRLGESSQEIGEITELISDITGQTNVLALNAAIQAASAGEAGRGFAVVAEEVQRLAERSADATRQIAHLVRAIQADTQDAVAAMEASTRGVVEGARLSDNAGSLLTEIDHLSRQVAELVEQIALSTAREAELASGTAGNIQHIFAVTEQTGDGTRATVQQVRELTRMADALRESVSRFRI